MTTSRSTKRPKGTPSTYSVRTKDLARLFYATSEDEIGLRPTRDNDQAARAVLADALEERGMHDLAMRLLRFPTNGGRPSARGTPGHFGSSLLHEKVRRAIFGPERRTDYAPRKVRRGILLADLGLSRNGMNGVREIDRWHLDSDWGRNYVFEVSDGGYGSVMFLVRADDESSALEIAEDQWPDWFFDEVDGTYDDDDPGDYDDGLQSHPTKKGVLVRPTDATMHLYRPRWVARARVLERAGSGFPGTAYVAGRGLVEYRS